MNIEQDLIVPLAVSLIGTALGSYITAILKMRIPVPPLLVNWLVGAFIYFNLVFFEVLPMSVNSAALYCIIMLGVNIGYWKNLSGLADKINRWAKDQKK